jgi:hypothetical protein
MRRCAVAVLGVLSFACQAQAPAPAATPASPSRWEYTVVVAFPVIRALNAPLTQINSITAPREPEGAALESVGADVPAASMARPVVLKVRYRDDVQLPRWAMGPTLVEYSNQLGAEGWELASAESFLHFTNVDNTRYEGLTVVFKRPR